MNTANKTPKHCNPITLIRSMVRSRAIDLTHVSNCVESQATFKLYNRSGDELFGTKETKQSPYSLKPTYTSS